MSNSKILANFLACVLTINAIKITSKTPAVPSYSSSMFQNYNGKRISRQTTLSSVAILADLHSLCAFLCLKRGAACFAAQYVAGSFKCELQLNCGVVLLEDATDNTSVYVPQWLKNMNPKPVRPYLYFPLVKGCNPSYSANYGLQSVSSPLMMFGNLSELNNSYIAMQSTPWFPSSKYPTPFYGLFSDNSSRLDLFQTSFTVSFMVFSTKESIQSSLTLFSSPTDFCIAFRVQPDDSMWIRQIKSCGCLNDGVTGIIAKTQWTAIKGWSHTTYAYDHPNTMLKVYQNGMFLSL